MSLTYSPQEFDKTVKTLRKFFVAKGFLEVHVQDRLSILAACENPSNIAIFNYHDQSWPLPQTGQMWLEHELLKAPSLEGVFCVTTSYRLEKDPIPGRHNTIFPMFEFESKGTLQDLMILERELCEYLGFGYKNHFKEVFYHDAMKKFNVTEIGDQEEQALCQELGPVVLLRNFPFHTSPFWNMGKDPQTNTASKVDVLLEGMETIGSAERATDREYMREQFYTISNGEYAGILFRHFGRERVEKELEEFLSFNFFPRYGGGIGLTRLIKALRIKDERLAALDQAA